MKRILKSTLLVLGVAAIAGYATYSFFSDTETSNNNTFTAGAIDLSLGGGFSSANNGGLGFLDLASDNAGRALYNFTDLKPGDTGGGSFNLQVTSNDAYVCAKSTITATPEGLATEPEVTAGDSASDPVGELQNYLQLATFDDVNTNDAYDSGEPINVNQYGGDGNGFTVAQVAAAGWVPVADTTSPNTWLVQPTLPSGVIQSAGMLYCFGNFTTTGTGADTAVSGCDGSGDQNVAQTDGVVGSIEFSAVQTRNNPGFTCASLNPTRVTSSVLNFGSTGWGGWSCPAGTHVVGGGTIGATQLIAAEGMAKPSTSVDGITYPVYPHYTYNSGAGETGYVVHNGAVGQSLQIYVDCLAN